MIHDAAFVVDTLNANCNTLANMNQYVDLTYKYGKTMNKSN